MKLRIASIAFLLSCLSVGIAWLTLQPSLIQLVEALRRLTPPGGPEE